MSALSLPSSVTSVTVFRRGALVTRTATLERGAEGFPAAVRLEGLPLLLDDDSLQVALHPVREGSREGVPEGQAPMAGDLRVTLAVPPADEALAPPTDAQLEAARLELATARQAHTDLEGIRRQVAELGPGVRGTPEEGAAPMASPTEARLALVALRRERLERLRTEVLEAAERVRLAQERLATLEERERRSSSARNPRTFEARKAVVVSLLPAVGHPAARLELRLRYFVVGARWAPTYVLRLDPSLRAGTLELRALVGQATGEPWNNVALTLSTAHPQRWTELPELHSLRIGRHQPPPAKTGWRPPPPGTELLYADYDRLGRAPGKAAGAGEPEDEDTMMFDADEEAATLDPGMDLEEIQAIAAEATASFALPETEVRTQTRDKKRRPSARTSRPMPPPAAAPMAPPMPMASMPPPGMAIPGDAPMMPMQAESKRGGLGGMIGAMMSSGGGPQADLVPAHGFEEPEEPPHTLMADRDQLAYGELWLPPADDAHRGALRRIGRAQRYGRLAALSPDQIRVALERGEQARAGARALEDRSRPAPTAGSSRSTASTTPIRPRPG